MVSRILPIAFAILERTYKPVIAPVAAAVAATTHIPPTDTVMNTVTPYRIAETLKNHLALLSQASSKPTIMQIYSEGKINVE